MTDPLYDESYARNYDSLYLHPWAVKHELNRSRILHCLENIDSPEPDWLDLCCGQAWHFSQFPDGIRKTGVDLSAAQLEFARQRNHDATFVHADVLEAELPDRSYDLVTCFWAAYCYLGSEERIGQLMERAILWTRTGGSLYFEILQPDDVASFNKSGFAERTGFRVACVSEDCARWTFEDTGGTHRMFSPRLDWFLGILEGSYDEVEARHDDAFMTHVIATRRRPD